MKWLKKVAATPLTSIAKVIDSIEASTNDRANAPSIHAVREAIGNNWLSIYPIGSIYMSVNNVDPSTIFGGTWRQIKDRFLLASGDTFTNGEEGGEISHELTVNEMPAHTHTLDGQALDPVGGNIAVHATDVGVAAGATTATATSSVTGLEVTGTAQSTGGGVPHNNMPPYLAVNVWVRTA